MADLLALSARVIDGGVYEGPASVNRVSGELSEVADGIAVVESFSHVVAFRTGEGLILHAVRVPAELLEKPYLRPVYDEPEFVVRNVWRLYGGWYDGNPAPLKPAPETALAAELAALAGGAKSLAARGRALAESGELRLACQLVELAAQAEPGSHEVHAARAEVYERRRKAELSLMARGIYGAAARDSARLAGGER